MIKSKYKYTLTEDERKELHQFIEDKRCSNNCILRCQILLKCDSGNEGGSWKHKKIAEQYDVSTNTVINVRKRMAEHGLNFAVSGIR